MIKALRLSLAAAILVAVSACLQPQPPAPEKQAADAPITTNADLNVMTFNIRYGTANDGEDRWEKRRGLLMDVIRANDPDVIGLQEALRFQIDEIRKEFPHYEEIGVGRDDGKTKGEYSAILFRTPRLSVSDGSGTFWFSDTPEKVASKTWGNGITRICSWVTLRDAVSGKRIAVYNLHLDHQSEPSRQKSAALLLERLNGRPADLQLPTIVTGDFNCGEHSVAIVSLADAGLLDSYRVVHPMEPNVRTFHAFKGVTDTSGKGGPQGALTEKIDFVLVDDKWAVLEAAIDRTSRDGRYPSDHFPVTARVRLKAN